MNGDNKRGIIIVLVACLGIMLLTGCISVDYVGQKFTPLKPDQRVVFYNSKSEVPENVYKTIGRAMATAPDGNTSEDVKQQLIDKAREVGADAIEVISFKRVKTGVQTIAKRGFMESGTVGNWMAASSTRVGGAPIYSDPMERSIPLKTVELEKFEIQAKVLFLVNKKKFTQEMRNFEAERARYLRDSGQEYGK